MHDKISTALGGAILFVVMTQMQICPEELEPWTYGAVLALYAITVTAPFRHIVAMDWALQGSVGVANVLFIMFVVLDRILIIHTESVLVVWGGWIISLILAFAPLGHIQAEPEYRLTTRLKELAEPMDAEEDIDEPPEPEHPSAIEVADDDPEDDSFLYPAGIVPTPASWGDEPENPFVVCRYPLFVTPESFPQQEIGILIRR